MCLLVGTTFLLNHQRRSLIRARLALGKTQVKAADYLVDMKELLGWGGNTRTENLLTENYWIDIKRGGVV